VGVTREFKCPHWCGVIPAVVRVQNRGPLHLRVRPALVRGRCVCNKASFPYSRPVHSAAAAAG
jgi:hypothetical protein